MAMEAVAENVYEFPINEKLLEEALQLKEDQKVVKERLDKIDQSRANVSDNVYSKVRQDYEKRLKQVTDSLLAKKKDIDHELKTLQQTREKIQSNLKAHQEVLEETKFRFELGEFPQQEFQQKARTQQEKIAKFESVLSGVEANINRYEALFEDLDVSQFETEAAIESPAEKAPISLETEEPKTVAENVGAKLGDLPASEHTIAFNPESEVSEISSVAAASVTVITGAQNVGDSFPIEETLSLGRAKANDIILNDAKASRQHAQVKSQGKDHILVDLNSSNGTLVNGAKIKEHVLTSGDEFSIGSYIIRFES